MFAKELKSLQCGGTQ